MEINAMKIISSLMDESQPNKCCSLLVEIDALEYLKLIEKTYQSRGGLKKQRAPLKTKNALKIRDRMVNDILKGAILPPIVIGICDNIPEKTDNLNEIISLLVKANESSQLFIIDGMQRTTAILEAFETNRDLKLIIRIELWISANIDSLLYRMMVLNTAQVSWNIRRQVEAVFYSQIETFKKLIDGIILMGIDDNSRRSNAGEFGESSLVDMFLAFGLRKANFKFDDEIAAEFSKMDLIEGTENNKSIQYFIEISKRFVVLDKEFGKNKSESSDNAENLRYNNGLAIFSSAPARTGFFAACGMRIFGKVGTHYQEKEIDDKYNVFIANLDKFLEKLKAKNEAELEKFLDLQTLRDRTKEGNKSNVGEKERQFFTGAFYEFFESIPNIQTMESCWRV